MRSETHICELRHTKIFQEQCVVLHIFLKFDVFKVCCLSKMVYGQQTDVVIYIDNNTMVICAVSHICAILVRNFTCSVTLHIVYHDVEFKLHSLWPC